MGSYLGANSAKDRPDHFLDDLYGNELWTTSDATIAQSKKANTASSPPTAEYPLIEDMIAIFGAIPSSIIIYASVHYNSLPKTAGSMFCVAAIAVVSTTIALTFAALGFLARSSETAKQPGD